MSLSRLANRIAVSTFSSILALACAADLSAAASLTQVSGPSPFAGCNISGEPGINYLNAEVEPWIEANPTNPNNLIAGFQQDRWSNGGARSNLSAYSNDGGATWTRIIVPGINKCAGGTGDFAYDRATDPWVTFSPNGTAYFMSLSFNNDRPDGGGGINAMLVNRSTNGGASWSAPTVLIRDTDGRAFNDKNAITADPTNSNYVYAVWDRLFDNTLPAAEGDRIGAGDGVARARANRLRNLGGNTFNVISYTGPSYFARTTDGGATWEPAREILTTGPNAQTIGNQVVVQPNGTVFNFFTHIYHNGQVTLGFQKSTNKGASFGPEQTAVPMNVTLRGTITPDAKAPVRDANILFDVAIDPQNGNLYLVWQEGKFQNIDRVYFSMSSNSGFSWSTPILIAKTPDNKNKLRMQSFVPSVEVGSDRKVHVTYYDFRNDQNAGGELTDYWAISCDIAHGANCRVPGGWGHEVRLTDSSFDMLNAPVARGHFLGDYQGLTRQGNSMRALFGVAVGPNLNDMFTRSIP
jgi:hypothetical protein